jgi:hypothetical protein
MREILISRHDLRIGAVVPQCLDVHYLPDQVYREMTSGTPQEYSDEAVFTGRQRSAHFEYRRALIYSPQVVINRAFLFSELVYRDFLDERVNIRNRNAFANLVEQHAIIPFLIGKSIAEDALTLDYPKKGGEAVESLSPLIDEIHCVRLSLDDAANRTQVGALGRMFRQFCLALGDALNDREALLQTAGELYGVPLEDEALTLFGETLVKISRYVQEQGDFKRETIYKGLFVRDGTEHHRGAFYSESEKPFLLAQKKLVDLRYNSNLPDLLGRFTLTPLRMPTRAALDPWAEVENALSEPNLEAWLEDLRGRAASTFFNGMHQTFSLPALSDLTIADVLAVRSLPEWSEFIAEQENILGDGLKALDRLERFGQALAKFQRAFSDWHYRTYGRSRKIEEYTSSVSVCISVGGATIAGFSGGDFLEIVGTGQLSAFIPRRVKGWVARLAVEVRDRTQRIHPDLSYSIDLVRDSMYVTREDLEDLFQKYSVAHTATANSGVA